MVSEKRWYTFGQDPAILVALFANVLSWVVHTFFPSMLPWLIQTCDKEEKDITARVTGLTESAEVCPTQCISIGRPGGLEQLRLVQLKQGIATLGYNVSMGTAYSDPISDESDIPSNCVVLRNEAFSVNYADCTIRWGLYESARLFVGWPIVPGFDIAGTIERVGPGADSTWKAGDRVFGCSLFGAYSSRVVVPDIQIRKIPLHLTTAQAAALPAVSLTALYALDLAGQWPQASKYTNRSILIHSAAGGVGSMLVQMSRVLRMHPIVGVVGSPAKVDAAGALGCDIVIDKSTGTLWEQAAKAAPGGYAVVMDSTGVSTLRESYAHLAPTGRLIVFGYGSNLPMGKAALSPIEWLKMARKASQMPHFDPMDLSVSNKSVLGFNLSFFADEKAKVTELFDQIVTWLDEGKIRCPNVVEMPMDKIAHAHELIQSGTSVGKIVMTTQ
eukprot:m.402616 g.402616  ORF g.402616 m.402616 type:complete len:443 (+) comp21183_c0_seq1:148-1476(+)